jgi:hypothetical protein
MHVDWLDWNLIPKPNQDFHTTKSAEVVKVKLIFLPFSPIMA